MSTSQPSVPAFTIRPTSKFVVFSYATVALLAALALFIAYRQDARREYFYVIASMAALGLFIAVKRHIQLQFTRLSFDGHGLKYQDGFVSKSTRMLNLSKIQDVRVDQGLTDRMLGIGTITLETAGESGRLVMRNIDEPQEIAHRILSLAQSSGASAGTPRA